MRILKSAIAIGSILAITSCNKLIEPVEQDLIAGNVALATVTNCESAIIGAYAGFGVETDILASGTFSDEMKTAGEFYNAQTTHEWQFTATDVGIRDNFTIINPQYRTIDRVNRVLAALPAAQALLTGDIAKKNLLRGEALFLRAFAHFQLFRYYCNNYTPSGLAMPYLTAVSFGPTTRIEMKPYFDKLNADLIEAKSLLPTFLIDINRASLLAAQALHARVALYQKDWVNAEAYSSAVITGLPLVPRAGYAGMWTDANSAEVVMQTVRTNTFRIGGYFRGTSAVVSGIPNIGTVTWMPSNKLWDSYDQVNDIRFSSFFKTEPILTAAGRQPRLISKYAGTAYATANENVNNAKIFRTGEMFLIRAEARAEQARFTGANSAESDINTLRTARITAYANVTFASQADAITNVLSERYKELCFEGHRFWDLKRRGLPVERLVADAPSAGGTTLSAGSYLFLLPIPFTEMQANSGMVQNPGYQ